MNARPAFRRRLDTALRCLAPLALAAMPVAALAHHPIGGAVPATAWHGLLSGLGHPVIGPDHLVFLLAAGLLGAWGGARIAARGLALLLAFVVAAAAGTLLQATLPEPVPGVAVAIAVSLLVLGAALALRRAPDGGAAGLLAALAGLAHGTAFGEAVIGAEPTPIVAYVAGLALVQALLVAVAFVGARTIVRTWPARAAGAARLAGGVTAAVGAVMLVALPLA